MSDFQLMDLIAEVVTERYGVTVNTIMSRRREREISDARHAIMYLSRKKTGLCFRLIGVKFDRDSSTVQWSCKVAKAIAKYNKTFKNAILECEKQIDILKN